MEGGVSDVVTGEGQIWLVDDDLRRIDPDVGEAQTIVPLKRSDPY